MNNQQVILNREGCLLLERCLDLAKTYVKRKRSKFGHKQYEKVMLGKALHRVYITARDTRLDQRLTPEHGESDEVIFPYSLVVEISRVIRDYFDFALNTASSGRNEEISAYLERDLPPIFDTIKKHLTHEDAIDLASIR